MERVGITGSSGFIGSHLRFYLYELKDKYEPVLIHTEDFLDQEKLLKKLGNCDAIVHLAGLNRGEEKQIYETNVGLTKTLLSTLESLDKKPKIIFLSSSHNTKNTAYGRSKKESQELIKQWGIKNKKPAFSIVAPHIFGEFGKPYYNSSVATLCYELAKNKASKVNKEAKVELVYVRDICSLIVSLFEEKSSRTITVKGKKMQLTKLYSLLKQFRDEYFVHTIPLFKNRFQLYLFNTLRSYLQPKPVKLDLKKDNRGLFIELIKEKVGGQTSFSTTYKNMVRGNHYHTRKIERFCVISGEAIIRLRKILTNKIIEYKLSGKEAVFIDMPTFYTHSIENISSDELLTMFWISEIYDPKDPDTFPEPVILM